MKAIVSKNDSANHVKKGDVFLIVWAGKVDNKAVKENFYIEIVDTTVTITDDIMNTGNLTAECTGLPSGISSSDVTYKWYKASLEDDKYTLVSDNKITFNDGSGNIVDLHSLPGTNDTAKNWLNVSADNGAESYYYVEAYGPNDNMLGTSNKFKVPYATELKNGGFKDPDITNDGANTDTHWQFQDGEVPYWHFNNPYLSGGTYRAIEIVGETSNPHGINGVIDGDHQCAEINCESDGALYQDVLVQPGETLNWQVFHQGRCGATKDKMAVLIMDSQTAVKLSADEINAYEKHSQTQGNPCVGSKVIYDINSRETLIK